MRLLLILFFSCPLVCFAQQKGWYNDIGINLGTNFSQDSNAMTDMNLHLDFGYAFSEKFRVGAGFPLGFLLFRDEDRAYQSFSKGFNLNINFRFFHNEIISLRSHTNFFSLADTKYKSPDKEWFFFKANTNIQCYFNQITTDKILPYVSIGTGYYYSLIELPDGGEKEYHYLIPQVSFGIIRRF